eukprot:309360_1
MIQFQHMDNQDDITIETSQSENQSIDISCNHWQLHQRFVVNTDLDDSYRSPNSSYLLYSSMVRQQNKCSISQCGCLQNIIHILNNYHKWIYFTVRLQGHPHKHLYNQIYEQHYTNTNLLNDFNHLLFQHHNEFEDIHNIMLEQCSYSRICDLSECLMLRRNYRNRLFFDRQTYFYQDDTDVIQQQLIDRIHSYFFHSYDIGHKLTREEIKTIQGNQDIKSDDIDYDINVAQINNLIIAKKKIHVQVLMALSQLRISL